MNKLLDDIIKFRNELKDQQQYLERNGHITNPCRTNAEMTASAADTLKGLQDKLDMLIAKHIIDSGLVMPDMISLVKRENTRRESIYRWGIV